MPSKDKETKSKSVSFVENNKCPDKEGDNCKEPGVHNDSAPIGGG